MANLDELIQRLKSRELTPTEIKILKSHEPKKLSVPCPRCGSKHLRLLPCGVYCRRCLYTRSKDQFLNDLVVARSN